MNTINVENCKTLLIGRRGENEVTTVAFDFTEWVSEFGSGVVDLYVKRNGDDSAYPVVLTIDGTVASWLVTETDTNIAGYGKAEYVYRVDGKIAKSAVFPFFVAEDIGQPASEPPDPYESWLEQLTALGAETEAHAQAAEQSAENAAESAEDAAQSAASAEGYAGQAETAAGLAQAAQTASEAARDAAQTAQTSAEASATAAIGSAASAAGSATAAAGSASDASSSASAAGASATTASTAAGQAEAAKTAAQAAQSAAEDAAEDAQQAAQQAHVEYEQLSGEVDDLSDEVSQQKSAIEDLQALTNRKAGMLVDSASGAIASFVPDSTIDNLLGVTVDIEPVQDLHGYDSPWPAGGGKNKLSPVAYNGASYNMNTGVALTLTESPTQPTINGNTITWTIETAWVGLSFRTGALKSGTYTTHLDVTDTPTRKLTFYVVGSDNVIKAKAASTSYNVENRTFTVDDNDYIVVFCTMSPAGTMKLSDLQTESGSSFTTYSPYSNECPISGWDSVEVERTGENIFDDAVLVELGGVKQEDGSVYFDNANLIYNKLIWDNPKNYTGQLAITLQRKVDVSSSTARLVVNYSDGTLDYLGRDTDPANAWTTYTLITPSTKSVVSITGTYGTNREFYWKVQIELGNTLTAYKPYSGNRYVIQLWQTVYGAKLTIAEDGSVNALVDRAKTTVGALSWSLYNTAFYASIQMGTTERPISPQYKSEPSVSSMGDASGWADYSIRAHTSGTYVYVKDTRYSTASAFKTAEADTEIVYELATPIVIDLDPVTIPAISGQPNNVWADAGDVDVTFAADVKTYIDQKIAAAVAAMS